MNKVLFVIPDKSYKSQDFISAARKLNLEIVIVTDSIQASEKLGANNIFSTNFNSVDKKFLEKLPDDIDLILPVDHSSVIFTSMLVEALSSKGNSTQSVQNCLYKERTRRILSTNGLLQPKYTKTNNVEDVMKWLNEKKTKTIVKPNTGVASIGVMSLEVGFNNYEKIQKIIDSCHNNEIVIEEFFSGREFAYEGYLKDGVLNRVVIFDKPGDYRGPYYEEKIFIAPADINETNINKIQNVCQEACNRLGLTNGPVHIEFKIIKDQIFIIEVNPRTIGGLCSRSLNFNLFKNSLEEVILSDLVLGKRIALDLSFNSSGVLMIPVTKEGLFKGLAGESEVREFSGVIDIQISLPLGSYIKKPPFSERYLGFIFANGKSNNETKETLLQCEKIIRPIIE